MNLDYKGVVAILIAGSLGFSVMITIVGLSWRNKQVGEAGGQVLIATVSGMLVALGYYMGTQNDKNEK
jgi:hypothetical protein